MPFLLKTKETNLMLRVFKKTITPAAVPDIIDNKNYDQDFFADDVTGTTWALINTATSDGLPHKVSITNNSAVDHSGVLLTIVGTGYYDEPLTEDINLPIASATIRTINYFKTITPPTADAAQGGDTFDVGIADEFIGDAYPSGMYYGNLNLSITLSGVVNYAIDHTFTNVQVEPATDWNWQNNANDNIADSTTVDFATIHPKAVRFKANSYDDGSVITIEMAQSYN